MEFRGIRRVNKPQSGLFSSHYYNSSFFNCQSEEKTVPYTILSDSKTPSATARALLPEALWHGTIKSAKPEFVTLIEIIP